MCLADYLTGNSDRHVDNWGFYHDYTPGELNTLYPAIDFNHAFDSNVYLIMMVVDVNLSTI